MSCPSVARLLPCRSSRLLWSGSIRRGRLDRGTRGVHEYNARHFSCCVSKNVPTASLASQKASAESFSPFVSAAEPAVQSVKFGSTIYDENMFDMIRDQIERAMKYTFRDPDWLRAALSNRDTKIDQHTIPEFAHQLEALGDKVYAVAFFATYIPQVNKREMFQAYFEVSSNEHFSLCAKRLGILSNLKIKNDPKAEADLIESLVGAVFNDSNLNLFVLRDVIDAMGLFTPSSSSQPRVKGTEKKQLSTERLQQLSKALSRHVGWNWKIALARCAPGSTRITTVPTLLTMIRAREEADPGSCDRAGIKPILARIALRSSPSLRQLAHDVLVICEPRNPSDITEPRPKGPLIDTNRRLKKFYGESMTTYNKRILLQCVPIRQRHLKRWDKLSLLHHIRAKEQLDPGFCDKFPSLKPLIERYAALEEEPRPGSNDDPARKEVREISQQILEYNSKAEKTTSETLSNDNAQTCAGMTRDPLEDKPPTGIFSNKMILLQVPGAEKIMKSENNVLLLRHVKDQEQAHPGTVDRTPGLERLLVKYSITSNKTEVRDIARDILKLMSASGSGSLLDCAGVESSSPLNTDLADEASSDNIETQHSSWTGSSASAVSNGHHEVDWKPHSEDVKDRDDMIEAQTEVAQEPGEAKEPAPKTSYAPFRV